MKVANILAVKGDFVATISPSAPLAQLVDTLFVNGIGAVVVSPDGSRVTGIVSERDIVRALAEGKDLRACRVEQIMTTAVHTTTRETPIDQLTIMMTQNRVRHIPVLDDDGALVGIVSIGDVVKSRMDELEDERAALASYITQGG